MAEKKIDRAKLEDALLAIYEESYDRVARYLFVRIGNQQEAEDLASETFVKALEALDSYQERGLPMEAWIFKIAHNLYVDYVRKVKKRQSVDIDEVVIAAPPDVEEIVDNRDRVEKLTEALNSLTKGQREVITLRFYSGLKSNECAEILGKKPGAVRQMQSDAIKILRQMLVENDE